MVIGHRVGEVTRVRTDRPRRPPNAFERDRSHGGRRSHLRATEPQRNLFPLHGNILYPSVHKQTRSARQLCSTPSRVQIATSPPCPASQTASTTSVTLAAQRKHTTRSCWKADVPTECVRLFCVCRSTTFCSAGSTRTLSGQFSRGTSVVVSC